MELIETLLSAQMLVCLFLAILFLQSGLDKVFDWSGNLGWLNSHFEKTFPKASIPVLLGTITVVEIAAGVLATLGAVSLLVDGSTVFAVWGLRLSAASIVMLFFGQRLAKDYDGAATLAIYF
ncbi:MAG: DoxX family protein, partial [Bacteroidota bacterium]